MFGEEKATGRLASLQSRSTDGESKSKDVKPSCYRARYDTNVAFLGEAVYSTNVMPGTGTS